MARNVLFICTDHWPGELLGTAGHPTIQTPTLDELARAGTRYTRAYSECPVCIPARRTIMTGTPPSVHGDRTFQDTLPMPDLPTLAQAFRDAGYQAYASGKLHVYPQRDRIGFDDVMLGEEGRGQYGVVDDYEQFLAEEGYPGEQFAHGMSNNQYVTRPWHLPEQCHNTYWTADQMIRLIKRRDPTRPGFWYLSFAHPHPPLTPPAAYLDIYRDAAIPEPTVGDWAADPNALPFKLKKSHEYGRFLSSELRRAARRAFYAQCTYIDHQIRRVIGTMREEGLLDDTVVLFTSDHGDMLGSHGLWAKRTFLEGSARVPMILAGAPGRTPIPDNAVDDRLVGQQDIMPTLLELCGIPVPDTVEGRSMLSAEPRETLYGEEGEGVAATRMVHDGRYKLIYYAAGNYTHLFDLAADPEECRNLADDRGHYEVRERLAKQLTAELNGNDAELFRKGELVGLTEPDYEFHVRPGLFGQRGGHWPPPPVTGISVPL